MKEGILLSESFRPRSLPGSFYVILMYTRDRRHYSSPTVPLAFSLPDKVPIITGENKRGEYKAAGTHLMRCQERWKLMGLLSSALK